MMSPKGSAATIDHVHHDGVDSKTTNLALQQSYTPDIAHTPVSKTFLDELASVMKHYFSIADALSADDLEAGKKGFNALKKRIGMISPPKGRQYMAWRSASKELEKILDHAHHAASLPDARSMFEKVSRHIITLEKHYGHSTEGKHFLAYCPMAFGNKGGYWLQKQKEIHNPYFGAKMLKCGEIREIYAGK